MLDGRGGSLSPCSSSLIVLVAPPSPRPPTPLSRIRVRGWGRICIRRRRTPPTRTRGSSPIGNYDIGCSNAGIVGDTGCLTLGTATNLVFSLAKLIVVVAVWLLEMATGFALETALQDAATSVATVLDTRILGPTRLSHLGLVISALYMGWQFLRGRIGAGATEFALSLAVFAALITVTTGAGFGGAVTGAMHTAGGISAEIVSLAADTDTGDTVSHRIGGALMASFVRDPYDTINWGQLLEDGPCEPTPATKPWRRARTGCPTSPAPSWRPPDAKRRPGSTPKPPPPASSPPSSTSSSRWRRWRCL